MAIVFKCSCGRGFKVPDEAAGKKVECKDCGELVRVPAQTVKQKVATAEAPPAESDDEDDYGMNFGVREEQLPTELPPRKSELQSFSTKKGKSKKSKPDAKAKPGEKKKGKKKTKGKSSSNKGLLIGGGVAAVLLVGVGVFFALSNSGPQEPEVVTYQEFAHDKGQFKMKYPSGWEVTSGGGDGGRPPYATFKDSTATITIKHSLKGGPIADMASLGGGVVMPGDLGEELPPAAKVHEFLTETQYSLDYNDYEETPGEKFQIPYGTGWLVEFTGSEGFGSKLKAYRLTLIGTPFQYNVICKCPISRWEKYQPIFKEVLNSISR